MTSAKTSLSGRMQSTASLGGLLLRKALSYLLSLKVLARIRYLATSSTVIATSCHSSCQDFCTHEEVTVNVNKNTVFDNGQTDKVTEEHPDADGLTINSGSSNAVIDFTLLNNKVTTSIDSDVSY